MRNVRIVPAGPDDGVRVLEFVTALLAELGAEVGELSAEKLTTAWRGNEDRHTAFLALAEDGSAVGVITLATSFALYAGGCYGIVNELYVAPDYRSDGVGTALIDAVRRYGLERGWRRIELTAPASERFARTMRFYENEGFVFTGPQLKLHLT